MRLEIENLGVRLGATRICEQVSLALPDGELGCLLGPSGSGKTSLLRAIAGFVAADGGRICIDGREVVGSSTALAPEARGVGMVFQDLALLPHRSVRDNIGFGLWKQDAEVRRQRVEEMLTLAGLNRLAERYPHVLSGGQQQRVAVARALAPAPRLLLMDEPFSGLDAELRLAMAQQLRSLVVGSGTTTLMVTHDQREALAIADHIGVLHRGRLQQWDTPRAIHDAPATRFVAGFVGDGVLLPATREADGRIRTELGMLPAGGDGTVGKTAMLQMVFSNNVQFPKNYAMTMGAENTVKEIPVNQHTTVEMHIIDVGGQDVYARNAQDFLTDIDVFIGVYDLANKLTFEGLTKWLDKARSGNRNMPGVIVANKLDLKDKAEVADHQGEQLARKYSAQFMQASAMRGVGCIEALQAVANEWAHRYEERARSLQMLQ